MTRTPLVLLLALAACTVNGDPASGPGAGDPRVELTARKVEPGQPGAPQEDAGLRAEGGAGRIVVHGILQTPDPCRQVTGTVEAAGGDVTLRVDAARQGEACIQVISAFAYDATVMGIAPGTYRLRVVHAYPGTGWETETALEQTVTVR